MRTLVLRLFLIGVWTTLPQTFALAEPPPVQRASLILLQGEQRLLRLPGLARYSLGSSVIRALPFQGRDALLIKGVTPGVGDLWVWKKDGTTEHRTLRVEKPGHAAAPALDRALGELQETEVLMTGAGVILRGEIQSLRESARIAGLLRTFPKEIHDETELSPHLLDEGHRQIQAWLDQSRNPFGLRLERLGSTLWLRGAIPHPLEKQAVERKVRALFPRIELDLSSLPDASPTVHFRVFLLEMRKNRMTSLGLSWPPLQANAFRVTAWDVQSALQLDVALQALEAEGTVRILSNPELVVRAPGEAELFAGGELPIRNQSARSSNVQWRPYGLTLKLQVTHVAGEKVRLDILTEVSHLDENISMDSVPGLQSNRMKTQVDARFGTPLLLSGLLQQGVREQARGLPLLSRIPILGKLFGSEDYLNERSELVAILLPQATPPPAPMEKVSRFSPRGKTPPPRNSLTPEKERALRQSPQFPWNAFE